MNDLTDEQKANAKKIMDEVVDFIWAKVEFRVISYGEPYEEAWEIVKQEILSEAES